MTKAVGVEEVRWLVCGPWLRVGHFNSLSRGMH